MVRVGQMIPLFSVFAFCVYMALWEEKFRGWISGQHGWLMDKLDADRA